MVVAVPDERYGDHVFDPDRDDEFERVRSLAAAYDPASRNYLAALEIGPGWRCLDVGAGPGTLSAWMAEQGCEVVALDRDTRFVSGIHPNVVPVEVNLSEPGLDLGRFDLVHSRFTLMHLPERDQLLARLATWVRPGGWLVLSDLAELGTASSPNEPYRRVSFAMWRGLAATIGTDINYGRQHPGTLATSGFADTGAAADFATVARDTPMANFLRLTINQCRPLIIGTGDADDTAIEQTLRYLSDPTTWDLSLLMITGWGRKAPV